MSGKAKRPKKQSPRPRSKPSPDKCPKVWEKNRREKMKEMFEELSRLLPMHDPAKPSSRIKIVQDALCYIRELQAQNEDLLNGGFDEVHRKKLESWKRRVKELLSRVDQLTDILRAANIPVPPLALDGVPTWTKTQPKHWTDKLSIPGDKVEEVLEQIAEAKRRRKQSESAKNQLNKRQKNDGDKGNTTTKVSNSSKENQPSPKANNATQTTKNEKKHVKVSKTIVPPCKTGSVPPLPPSCIVTSAPPTASLLQGSIMTSIPQGSIMTPLPQPSTFLLTSQGSLLPVLTPNANLLTPVVINKPPMLVVQQPTVAKSLPLILARPPLNKRRIQRESTVMTFSNRLPIPALSSHSHTRRSGKCIAHKTQGKAAAAIIINAPAVTSSPACKSVSLINETGKEGAISKVEEVVNVVVPTENKENKAGEENLKESGDATSITASKTAISEEALPIPSSADANSVGNKLEDVLMSKNDLPIDKDSESMPRDIQGVSRSSQNICSLTVSAIVDKNAKTSDVSDVTNAEPINTSTSSVHSSSDNLIERSVSDNIHIEPKKMEGNNSDADTDALLQSNLRVSKAPSPSSLTHGLEQSSSRAVMNKVEQNQSNSSSESRILSSGNMVTTVLSNNNPIETSSADSIQQTSACPLMSHRVADPKGTAVTNDSIVPVYPKSLFCLDNKALAMTQATTSKTFGPPHPVAQSKSFVNSATLPFSSVPPMSQKASESSLKLVLPIISSNSLISSPKHTGYNQCNSSDAIVSSNVMKSVVPCSSNATQTSSSITPMMPSPYAPITSATPAHSSTQSAAIPPIPLFSSQGINVECLTPQLPFNSIISSSAIKSIQSSQPLICPTSAGLTSACSQSLALPMHNFSFAQTSVSSKVPCDSLTFTNQALNFTTTATIPINSKVSAAHSYNFMNPETSVYFSTTSPACSSSQSIIYSNISETISANYRTPSAIPPLNSSDLPKSSIPSTVPTSLLSLNGLNVTYKMTESSRLNSQTGLGTGPTFSNTQTLPDSVKTTRHSAFGDHASPSSQALFNYANAYKTAPTIQSSTSQMMHVNPTISSQSSQTYQSENLANTDYKSYIGKMSVATVSSSQPLLYPKETNTIIATSSQPGNPMPVTGTPRSMKIPDDKSKIFISPAYSTSLHSVTMIPSAYDSEGAKKIANPANSLPHSGTCSMLPDIVPVTTQVPTSLVESQNSPPKGDRMKESSATDRLLSYGLNHSSTPSNEMSTFASKANSTPDMFPNPSLPHSFSNPASKSMPPPAVDCTRPTTQFTAASWSNMTQSGTSTSVPTTEVSWPHISALRTPNIPPVSGSENSWLLKSVNASFNDGTKSLAPPLSTTSSSWRPNELFWGSENWVVNSSCKELAPPLPKKSKQAEKISAGGTKPSTVANIGVPNDAIQWPMSSSSVEIAGSHIGMYPFSSSSGLYSTPLSLPVSEGTWAASVPVAKPFIPDSIIPVPTINSNKSKLNSSPISTKTQVKESTYYTPAIPYLPPVTNYCSQEFSKDHFYSNNSTFFDPRAVSVPSSNQSNYSKSNAKQSVRTSASKSFSSNSNPVSVIASTKSADIIRQTSSSSKDRSSFIGSTSTPTYILSSCSKVSANDTFYPACHYTVADSNLYNPFTENSYTSSLLKQTLPENPPYGVNFSNAYPNDGNSKASYHMNVTKSLLNNSPYALPPFKTSTNESYYTGVPTYSNSAPTITPSEQTVYANSLPKSVSSELRPGVCQSSSSTTLTSLKVPGNEKAVVEKGLTQVSGVKSAQSNYPVKTQLATLPVANSASAEEKLHSVPSSKCGTLASGSAAVKTNISVPPWNPQYLSQVPPISNASDNSGHWGQADYGLCSTENKDSRSKQPINWMTEPEARSDIICQPNDPFQSRCQTTFDKKDSQNIFDYCVSEDDIGKGKSSKKDNEPASQDFFSWTPVKVDPLVVSGTLPTLVGDLALGGDPLPSKRGKSAIFLPDRYSSPRCSKENKTIVNPQEPFTNLSKNIFDFAQSDIPKSSSTETIVLKNIFELPAPLVGKQKPSQAQNSFLSVSQLVDSHNLEPNVEKNEYSYYTQKPGKAKRSSGWKCNEKKCQQTAKNGSSYSAEALLRSQDVIPTEPDFNVSSSAAFPIDFPPEASLIDTSEVTPGQLHSKPKSYSQRIRKQDCWKGQDLRQGPAINLPPITSVQQYPGKPVDSMSLPFPYLPDPRLSAPPLPPCGAPMAFPRFPTNPSTAPLLAPPGFQQRKPEPSGVHFSGIFPSSPGRPPGQTDGSSSRYPGPKKPYSYPRSNKAVFPPFSPSFSSDGSRKSAVKTQTTPVSFPAPAQPAGPSGSSLANFNLSTIFPEMNKKGNYPYP